MMGIYIIIALTFFGCGFSFGMMLSTYRMAAIMDRVTAEALRLERERGYTP